MSLEVCLLMMQNNWVWKGEFCKVMLMQTITEPGLLIANELIQELEFSLRTIKFLESVKISSSLSEEGLSFLQKHAPYADVEKLGILHLDHCFTAAYVSVLLAMFCEGKMSHQRVLRNSISSTEAQACIGVLEKIKEFIGIVDDSPHPIDVSLLDQSAIIIRSVFYTADTSSQ